MYNKILNIKQVQIKPLTQEELTEAVDPNSRYNTLFQGEYASGTIQKVMAQAFPTPSLLKARVRRSK